MSVRAALTACAECSRPRPEMQYTVALGVAVDCCKTQPASAVQVHHCNDFFTSPALQIVACLPALRTLRLEDVQSRMEPAAVGQLSSLRKVRP